MRSNQSEKNGRSGPRGLRDLEDRQAPARSQHATELAEGGVEIRDVPHPEADRRGVERAVVERQREEIALDPFDGRRLASGAREHRRREVEPRDDGALPLGRDGEVARAAAGVEHPVTRTARRPRRSAAARTDRGRRS